MTWPEDADAITREVQTRLLTPSEFDSMLADLCGRRGSPVAAVRAEIKCPDPLPSMTVGQPGVGTASDVETWDADEHGAFQVRTELWWREAGNEAHQMARTAFRRLISAWWRGDGRNEKSRLLSGQNATTQRALEDTIRTWLASGPVLFCAADIDNFAAFNNNLGLPAGDKLIAKLGGLLLQRAPRDCLIVHRSGDEFCLVFPATTPSGAATAFVMALREQVEALLRESVEIDPMPGLSIGVALCATPIRYSELEDLAGKALKPGGQKRRGRVTVIRPPLSLPPAGVSAEDLYLLRAVNLLGVAEPFGDPLLDAASYVAYEQVAQSNDIKSLPSELAAALGPFAEKGAAPPPEVVVAAAHGVARAALTGQGPDLLDRVTIRTHGGKIEVAVGAERLVVAGEGVSDEARSITLPVGDAPSAVVDSRQAVLVTIGDSDLKLPRELFAATIFVDDRPTRGGGLPDLWEAAIAQLVACLTQHSNVKRVFVAGSLEHGTQTLARLHKAGTWDSPDNAEALARRIGAPSMSRISEAGRRIAGRVTEVSSGLGVAVRMLDDLTEATEPFRPPNDVEPAPEPPRLRRILAMENMLPGKEDGCRVATASEAFPVALDIVRQLEDTVVDQTGRAFRELVDFRIQLSQPQINPVPRFYLTDRKLLEEYFEREFVRDDGLFRSRLAENGQLEAVVGHVAQVVATGRLTSRRALLVVPHVPTAGANLSPLGFVSARIIPRPLSPGTIRLDYSFSWRTVEALVGLPYSLYGSIRFAEHLTQLVGEQLTAAQPAVSMGSLSYIAHSLHMFVDEYADQVARRIVNDDSL